MSLDSKTTSVSAPPDREAPHGAADRDLVAAILRRDRKATAEFVEQYADSVYAFVRRRLVPRLDVVDDIVQKVFMAAITGLRSYAGTSSLRGWLLGIARHKVEDYYRACLKQPLSVPAEEADALAALPLGTDTQLDRTERVHGVLASLPERYRIALMWRYWEKRSAREMAEASGRSEKAIERLLARARQEFRRRWDED